MTSQGLSPSSTVHFSQNDVSVAFRAAAASASRWRPRCCVPITTTRATRVAFSPTLIAQDPSFEKHLNKYPVIFLDLTSFISYNKDNDIVERIDVALLADVGKAYPDVPIEKGDMLMDYLLRLVEAKGQTFVFIIDEWDAICREYAPGSEAMDRYVGWLRRMFKSHEASRVFAGVYMTGILPIKKYKTQSALNNFIEYSMVEPVDMGQYFGFTQEEVKNLAEKHGLDFDELEKWYDGYQIGDEHSIFNPNSVMQAIRSRRCRSFWASTGSYDTVSHYIAMNYEGLRTMWCGCWQESAVQWIPQASKTTCPSYIRRMMC